jgi:hypothetical protein
LRRAFSLKLRFCSLGKLEQLDICLTGYRA